jgi:dTDP-glucose 4,6-dehydratase
VKCDIGHYRQLELVLQKHGPFDLVYNCAAEFGRWNGEDFYEQMWRTNVVGLKNILRLAEIYGLRLVHLSSSEIYGDYDCVMVESVPDKYALAQQNDYAISKWANELQIRNSAAQMGTEAVVVRLFNTYGPGEYYSPYRSVNCRFLFCALRGLPWTVFQGHSRTSSYLWDVSRTLANIAEFFRPGAVYNIAGSHAHTIEELSDVVLAVTGASRDLVRMEAAEPMTTQHKAVNTRRAREELGHEDTVDLMEGMQKTAEWMRGVYQ